MTEITPTIEESIAGVLPIHFNVQGHALPLSTFIATASQTGVVVNALIEHVFNNHARFEVLVLPPEPGSHRARYLIKYTGGVLAAALTFLNSEVGSSYVEGFTGHPTSHWAKESGEYSIELIDGSDEETTEETKHRCLVNAVIAESVKGFMTKEYSTLLKSGFSKEKLRDAYQAKNTFYEACIRSHGLQGIGFDESEEFPLERNDFFSQIVSLPPEPEDDGPWFVEITNITATSPNWDHLDGQRGWKARLPSGKTITFNLEDETFWSLIQSKKIEANIPDYMKVQMAFIQEGARRKRHRALRVLEFNGQQLADPLRDKELEEILGPSSSIDATQTSLF